MRDRRCLPPLLVAALATPASLPARAAETSRPLYELGLVAGGGWFPDYPGAGQNHPKGIGAPYVIYRGDFLRSDETGVRGRFLRGERVQLDLSLGGALPADSSDNNARRGMPDLDLMGEIGPDLRVILRREEAVQRLDLDLGLRAAFTTDLSDVEYRGLVLQPELSWKRLDLLVPGSRLRLGMGPILATGRYMDYFYDVEPRFARSGRPTYEADPGYLGTRLQGSFRFPVNPKLSLSLGGRVDGLWGATNDDSPLFKESLNVSVVAGVAYSFHQSGRRTTVSYDPLD